MWSGTQTAQRERAHDVVRVGDALAREIDRRREVLENLTGLVRPLLGDLLRCEDVHRNGELLGRRMPRARADHDVDRRQADRLLGHREILLDR